MLRIASWLWVSLWTSTILLQQFPVSKCQIECSSAYECKNTTVNSTTESIWLSGYSSGREAISFSGANIYCSASYSCFNVSKSIIAISGSIECYGYYSCGETNITSTSGNIQCYATKSCMKSTLTAPVGNIFCDGEISCAQSTFINANFIYGQANYSLYGSIIKSSGQNTFIFLRGLYNFCMYPLSNHYMYCRQHSYFLLFVFFEVCARI